MTTRSTTQPRSLASRRGRTAYLATGMAIFGFGVAPVLAAPDNDNERTNRVVTTRTAGSVAGGAGQPVTADSRAARAVTRIQDRQTDAITRLVQLREDRTASVVVREPLDLTGGGLKPIAGGTERVFVSGQVGGSAGGGSGGGGSGGGSGSGGSGGGSGGSGSGGGDPGGGDTGGGDPGSGGSGGSGSGGSGGGSSDPGSSGETFARLVPGNGFDKFMPNSNPVGHPEVPGYDAKAIARWDVVPYQVIDGEFHIGVVAFHMNDIDHVLFSAEGGPWKRVDEMQLNPRTNVWEYTAVLDAADFQDGPIEIRAVVYPKVGVPRVLAGPIDGHMDGDPNFRNGNHSMILNANSGGSLPRHEVWADAVNGSDETGDGTQANPFRSAGRALAHVTATHGSSDNAVCYLMPGEYSWVSPGHPHRITTEWAWATVTAAPGVDRSKVVFTANGPRGFATRLLRAERISMDGHGGPRTHNQTDTYFWLDQSVIDNKDRYSGSGPAVGSWSGQYVTNSLVKNVKTPLRSATFVRNTVIEGFSNTPLGTDAFVVNAMVRDFSRNPSGTHADVFHWFWNQEQIRENRIVYGLQVYNFHLQGFQMNSIRNGGQRVDNVAFVNVHISKDSSGVAGSWWSIDTDHLLFKNVQMPDQTLRFRVHPQDADGILSLTNVAIRNSIFNRLNVHDNVLDGAIFDRVHVMDGEAFGTWVPPSGTNVTVGTDIGGATSQEIFIDPVALDYRPKPFSAIYHRTPASELGVRADVLGRRLSGTSASIGAFFAGSDSWASD